MRVAFQLRNAGGAAYNITIDSSTLRSPSGGFPRRQSLLIWCSITELRRAGGWEIAIRESRPVSEILSDRLLQFVITLM